MTAVGGRDGSPKLTLDGRAFRLGPGWYLCSFRLPTSMPIPLAVASVDDIDLVTWAFTGMRAPAPRPTCLLLLRPRGALAETALAAGTRLVVTTHFHDIAVSTAPAGALDAVSSEDRDIIVRALLSSVTAGIVAALADLASLLAPTLRAMPVPEAAPNLTMIDDRPGSCMLPGTEVPNYILLTSDAGMRCMRVANARMTFAGRARMALDLEPVWGPEIGTPARALLVDGSRFTAARLHPGEA